MPSNETQNSNKRHRYHGNQHDTQHHGNGRSRYHDNRGQPRHFDNRGSRHYDNNRQHPYNSRNNQYNHNQHRGRGHPHRRDETFPDDVIAMVTKLFNKSYRFRGDYQLPDVEAWFTEPPFKIGDLQRLKGELNVTKNLLNDKDKDVWHQHTRFTNPAGFIMRNVRQQLSAELLTQAWAKFHEMSGRVVPDADKFTSVHICEAPGGFICSLNHYLQNNRPGCQWTWHGMTLNPYFEGNSSKEMVDDDLFISKTYDNWCFGSDNTGNVMVRDNITFLKDRISAQSTDRPVLLVTADGSIDCQDNPNEQEATVSHLHYCETVTAITLLHPGGNFLLKGFTLFESTTMCLTYLLCGLFDTVEVVKPLTSKSGNSETYTICRGFRGIPRDQLHVLLRYHDPISPPSSLFPLSAIPQPYIEEFTKCAALFMGFQRNMIQSNIRTFENLPREEKTRIFQVKNYAVQHYLQHACKGLKSIPPSSRLVTDIYLDGTKLNTTAMILSDGKEGSNRCRLSNSHSENLREATMSWFDRVVKPLLEVSGEETKPKAGFAEMMMQQMGYEEGKGLGKSGDGIRNPIEVQQLEPGTGLGYTRTKAGHSVVYKTPEDIKWKSFDATPPTLRPLFGKKVDRITSSRFVSPDAFKKMSEAQASCTVLSNPNLGRIGESLHSYYPHHSTRLRADLQISEVARVTDTLGETSVCLDLTVGHKYHAFLSTSVLEVNPSELQLDTVADVVSLADQYLPTSVDVIVADSPSKFKMLAVLRATVQHLKSGGSLILHVGHLHDRLAVGVVSLISSMFKHVTFLKTAYCPPHSPEVFVVGKSYRPDPPANLPSLEKLDQILKSMEGNPDQDLVEVIPVSKLFSRDFYLLVVEVNERLADDVLDVIIELEKECFLYFS